MPGELIFLPESFLDLKPEDHEAIDQAVDAMSIEEMVVKENPSFNPEHYRTLLKCALKRDFASWSQYKTEISGKILLRGATLSFLRERLFFERVDLQGANLRNVNFRNADLQDADLFGANLMEANLMEANLQGADLQIADLQRADLRRAHLSRTNFRNTDLQEADLFGANLQGADLFGAHLQGAHLEVAMYDKEMLKTAKLDDEQKIKYLGLGEYERNERELQVLRKELQEKEDEFKAKLDQLKQEKDSLKETHSKKLEDKDAQWTKQLNLALINQEETLRKQWDEEQETKKKQEKAADEFIEPVEKDLKTSSEKKASKGHKYFIGGIIILFIAVAAVVTEFFLSYDVLQSETSKVIYRSTRVLAFLLLLAALAKYFYSLGRSYTRESIKEADRIHILKFGKFYLQAFPIPETHAERKDIFADWNKASYDSFGDIKIQDIDPKIVELTQSLIQLAKTSAKDDKSEKKTGSDS